MLQSFDLLDLTIALTPPPENAPEDALASMIVRCDALGLNHAAGLLTDPLTPQERADLRWYLEEYSQWPYAEFAVRGKRIEAQLSEIGKRLYQTAFGAVMGQVQPWRLLPTKQRQISIVSTIPAALSLPWELLHDEQGFLVLRTRQPVALLRRLEQHELSELPTSFRPPMRVLVVTARPSGTGFLDPRSLPRELLDAVQPQIDAGAIEVEFLRPPTRAALRQRLAQTKRPVHLLHFDGHGVFAGQIDPHDTLRKRGGGQGMLAFEDAEGKLDLVKAEDLAQLLQDSGVKLVVLDACQSAMSADDDAFSSVAARLIQGGVDATVAMSASVLVVSSTRFFARFYRELAASTPVPIAQERARQDLYDDPRRHLFRRRADEEGQPIELSDWWLPHYYQQRPLTLRATKMPRKRKSPPNTTLPRFNDDMPKELSYRFEGRARELLQIERHLLRKRLVVISGFGGIGKTALAREAADWFTRTEMYSCACFISFAHGGDASLLLSALGTFLGVNDGSRTPKNPDVALTQLQLALSARPTLLIADNLESLLPTGDAPLERAARSELWRVLRKLAGMGAGVLLTSRSPLAGEDLLAPGTSVADLPLGGLTSSDAYALATRLLEDLSIDRTRAPYAELRDLLAHLDHHPLAIRLVLPTLRKRTLDTIRTDFAALLPSFTDDTTTGRNRSLLASLDYSLRQLSPVYLALLPRLAVFEGGTSEDNLLKITDIPEATWAVLKTALVQTALLSPESIPGIAVPFLRFHPIFTPFLRSQPGAEELDLLERSTTCYLNLTQFLYQQDIQHPQMVRALFATELPNLRRTLARLVASGTSYDLERAAVVAEILTFFLTALGRWHERDALRHQLAALPSTAEANTLSQATYLQEDGLAEDEFRRGNLGAATVRFTRLLAQIEAQPVGTPRGPNSYEHSATLSRLARCLLSREQLAGAEDYYRQALVIIDALLQREPKKALYLERRRTILSESAMVLRHQGHYPQARELLLQTMLICQLLGDQHGLAATEGQLGTLAQEEGDLAEAQKRHQAALSAFQRMDDPEMEAVAWHELGMVAEEQQQWEEAERCYRASLILKEQLGSLGAAEDCNQLGNVTEKMSQFTEAEAWYRRALAYHAQANPGQSNAIYLHNLANLLVKESQASSSTSARLTEARHLEEQALALQEADGSSSSLWAMLETLARITDLEGQPEQARALRRRAQDAYVAFPGNRYRLEQQMGHRIASIAAATQGNEAARQQIEAALPQLEAMGWHLTTSTHRLWAGERNWHTLVEGLDYVDSLLIFLVLEALNTSR